ncbi:MAG: cobalamin-dependent protein [Thermodesulfovibrionia bacterium]|nr:cobalamin-dependent protein [Thermodesulfovibrionia bacterium]
MKILLVNPPNSGISVPVEKYGLKETQKIFKGEPFALEVLAGNLENHDTRILDLKIPGESLEKEISSFSPDLVAFTSLTCEANTVLKISRKTKDIDKNITIVVGGVHASSDPDFFNRDHIDYLITGLGKLSFRELVDSLETNGCPEEPVGVARTNPQSELSFVRRKFTRSDLVEEKPPAYDLITKYRDNYVIDSLGITMGYINTACGCPNQCSFCCIGNTTGNRYLEHSLECVIRDLSLLKDIPIIRLVDANTFAHPGRARNLCNAIKDNGFKKRFIADACADSIVSDLDLFAQWQKAGLHAVIIGFEEIDNERLSNWKKKNTFVIVQKAIEILHDLNISIVGNFIISPDYREDDFRKIETFIEKSAIALPVLSVLTPLPGTPLCKTMQNDIIIHNLDYYTLGNAVTKTALPEREFYTILTELQDKFHRNAKL